MTLRDMIRVFPKLSLVGLVLMRIYLSAFNVLFSILMQVMIGNIENQGSMSDLFLAGGTMVLLSLGFIGIYFAFNALLQRSMYSIRLRLGERIMKQILYRPEGSGLTQGELLNLMTTDIENIVQFILYGVVPLLDVSLTLLFGLCYVFAGSPWFGLLFLLAGLVVGLLNVRNGDRMEQKYEAFAGENDQQLSWYEEFFRAIPLVRFYRIRQLVTDLQQQLFEKRRLAYRGYNNQYALVYLLTEGGILIFEMLSLFVGLYLVLETSLSLATMLGVRNAALGSILYPLGVLPVYYNYFSKYRISLKRLNHHLVDGDELSLAAENVVPMEQGDWQVEHLAFAYGDRPIFTDASYQIPETGLTFIVGGSGQGKSTLLQLLLGLLQPQKGRVLLAGRLVTEPVEASFVPQVNALFDTSIRENLTLGDQTITDQRIAEVCQRLQIWSLIESLPQGLDTVYGQTIQFSNGQMRRLAVARAVLADSPRLLLDEPFSDLDAENQSFIMDYLGELRLSKSIVIISHPLDFVSRADQVIKVGD